MVSLILRKILYVFLFLNLFISLFSASFKIDSGEVFNGILKEMNKETFIITNQYGTMTLPRKSLKSMDFSGENLNYVVLTNDGTKIQANLISMEEGFITVNTGGGIINIDFSTVDEIFNLDYKIQKDKEDKKKINNSFNEFKAYSGYGVLSGDFKNYYKNSILFGFSYSLLIPITINDYPIFRLGLDTFYQSLTAKQVETTKMKNYSFIGFIKIGYFFIPEKLGFWSNFYPYFRAGYGQNVTILSTKSGSESNDDIGLDPCYFLGGGIDYYAKNFIFFVETDYFVIKENDKQFKELKLFGGIGIRI